MTNIARALYQFFSGFGIPAYPKNNIPDNAEPPYISYEVKAPEPLARALLHAWVWYRGTDYTAVAAKCDAIRAAIGTGVTISAGGGSIAIFRDNGTPFAQEQPDPDKTSRVMYLTMVMLANTD